MCDAPRLTRRRNAFTLIELLVVIVLILAIAALGVGYVVFGQDNQHSVTAAQKVTGALLNTKGRVRQEGIPTGIRLLFGTNGLPATQCGQFVLVQQPEDYIAGACQCPTAGDANRVTLNLPQGPPPMDILGGAQYPGEIDQATVEAGDYFMAIGSSQAHRIGLVNPDQSLELNSTPGALPAGTTYTIVRAPRRLPSEDVIQLPPNIVIDNSPMPNPLVNPNQTLCQNLPQRILYDANNPYPPGVPVSEIVFSSAGGLTGQGTSADKVLLWLRDPSLPTPTAGAPLIVSVQVRTGFISVYPVAPWNTGLPISPTNDPYAFAKDGRASGM